MAWQYFRLFLRDHVTLVKVPNNYMRMYVHFWFGFDECLRNPIRSWPIGKWSCLWYFTWSIPVSSFVICTYFWYFSIWSSISMYYDNIYVIIKCTGSGFKSMRPFRSGYFGTSIKLQPGYTAGVITAFYVSLLMYSFYARANFSPFQWLSMFSKNWLGEQANAHAANISI